MKPVRPTLTYLGIAVVAAGFVVILITWGKVGAITAVPLQMPYLLSGGLVGLGLIIGGFAMIGMGWRGGAATLFVPTQVAFGVSGGMAGLGLIGTGLAVLLVQMTRLSTARRTRDLQLLVSDTVEVFAAVRERTDNGSRRLQLPLPRIAESPVAVPSGSNGHASPAQLAAGAQAWEPDVLLVPGGKTFHAPGCRIIAAQATPLRLTTDEAQAAGLRPCRICGAGVASG